MQTAHHSSHSQHRHVLIQVLVLAAIAVGLWWAGQAIHDKLAPKGIATGFDFLWSRAGFDLSESVIDYDGSKTYAYALLAGFLNTLKVALCAIVLSVLLGLLAALAQLSQHDLANRIAKLYVAVIRNTPLLLQLFFWFSIFTVSMPSTREAINPVPGWYLSNRGIDFPWPTPIVLVTIVATLCALGAGIRARALAGEGAPGRGRRPFLILCALATALAVYAFGSGQFRFEWPSASTFSIIGGGHVSPEFLSMFVGLSVYTGTYIAEAIRGAVQSISQGQVAAGHALGLNRSGVLRYIVMPQAIRIAMPAVISELLNLVKNSSLGVAVGYPELVSAGNTAMNQTGQAIELIAIYMVVYVSVNFLTTRLIGIWERRYAW